MSSCLCRSPCYSLLEIHNWYSLQFCWYWTLSLRSGRLLSAKFRQNDWWNVASVMVSSAVFKLNLGKTSLVCVQPVAIVNSSYYCGKYSGTRTATRTRHPDVVWCRLHISARRRTGEKLSIFCVLVYLRPLSMETRLPIDRTLIRWMGCSTTACLSTSDLRRGAWLILPCLWPPYVIGQVIIFLPCGFFLLSSSIFLFLFLA